VTTGDHQLETFAPDGVEDNVLARNFDEPHPFDAVGC
jgi:hypothetical protein